MHHAPATARAPRVCTLVPFIIDSFSETLLVLFLEASNNNQIHYLRLGVKLRIIL